MSIFGFLKKTLFAPVKTTLRAGSKRTIIAEISALLGYGGGDRTFIAEISALLGYGEGDQTFYSGKIRFIGLRRGRSDFYSGKIRFIGLCRGQNRRVTWTNEVFCLLHWLPRASHAANEA
ncbi:hypothetical protein B1748_22045 [Paenibacillus sp. MY03]|uniref:hypothetical protein n=1 Tax=Paenibacillus sp. MY03 TaxID=302980 RepID=UPI000B3C72C8|nr:hypothetical protein [Paenibacillus sp. MY03]OUS74024.1 hypothetical protein B1748_22045 [Paenibacillus sp. MY03]